MNSCLTVIVADDDCALTVDINTTLLDLSRWICSGISNPSFKCSIHTTEDPLNLQARYDPEAVTVHNNTKQSDSSKKIHQCCVPNHTIIHWIIKLLLCQSTRQWVLRTPQRVHVQTPVHQYHFMNSWEIMTIGNNSIK